MSKICPYIGITGFMSKDEVKSILDVVPVLSQRALMVGVLASQKTIFFGQQNKRPNHYPKAADIAHIFPCHSRTLNFIHYHTKETETLAEQLTHITELGGPFLDGFQLNIAWPNPRALERFRKAHPDMFIVLQIGNKAFELVENNPSILARRVAKDYLGLVEYVLLDPSGGFGKQFDTNLARLYLDALREQQVEQFIWLGVAGGLSHTTLNLVGPLVKYFPELCIDAEGRLRNEHDILDIELAKQYVQRSLKIFQKQKQRTKTG